MKSILKPAGASIIALALAANHAQAQAVISGYLSNPAGTDSPFEYVQFVATQNINFATTPMSVVFANNGTATTAGWVAGGSLTYGMILNSGTVSAGQAFYVGGSGKTIDGSGSTDISSLNFIRTLNTGTTAGDLFGTAASAGVVGNGGSNADGIGLFLGTSLTSSSVPIDAVFYGAAVGSAFVSGTTGYTLPVSDIYNGGVLQSGSTIFSDPGSAQYEALSGTYNTDTGTWTTARTGTLVNLTTGSAASAINPLINVVPEPSTYALGGLGLAALGLVRRFRKN